MKFGLLQGRRLVIKRVAGCGCAKGVSNAQ